MDRDSEPTATQHAATQGRAQPSVVRDPYRACGPLLDASGHFAGSAFVLEVQLSPTPKEFPQIVVTAGHVVEQTDQELTFLATPDSGGGPMTMIPTRGWRVDRRHDLAVGFLPTDFGQVPALPVIAQERPAPNWDVMTIEWSDAFEWSDDRRSAKTTPLTRKGNIVLRRTGHWIGHPDTEVLELSYPALKGASGAPVFIGDPEADFLVVGVVVANRSSELLATQIETVTTGPEEVEETIRFLMPNALAVSARHLRDVVGEAVNAFVLDRS